MPKARHGRHGLSPCTSVRSWTGHYIRVVASVFNLSLLRHSSRCCQLLSVWWLWVPALCVQSGASGAFRLFARAAQLPIVSRFLQSVWYTLLAHLLVATSTTCGRRQRGHADLVVAQQPGQSLKCLTAGYCKGLSPTGDAGVEAGECFQTAAYVMAEEDL